MTVIRALAKLYISNHRTKDAVALYEDARQRYLSLPQTKKPDGDLDTPFDWYPRRCLDLLTLGTS